VLVKAYSFRYQNFRNGSVYVLFSCHNNLHLHYMCLCTQYSFSNKILVAYHVLACYRQWLKYMCNHYLTVTDHISKNVWDCTNNLKCILQHKFKAMDHWLTMLYLIILSCGRIKCATWWYPNTCLVLLSGLFLYPLT
jgi:hypothetical protein